MCSSSANAWETSTHFGRHMQCLLWPNLTFHHVIGNANMSFSYWYDVCWCLSPMTILLFFLLFSLLPKKYMLVLFFFGVSISVLIILIYNFFWSFYKNFIFSQFSTLIAICHILSFPIQSLFL